MNPFDRKGAVGLRHPVMPSDSILAFIADAEKEKRELDVLFLRRILD